MREEGGQLSWGVHQLHQNAERVGGQILAKLKECGEGRMSIFSPNVKKNYVFNINVLIST